ncbi:unnamed protein product, partial [Musa acuminata var. zebrina]
MEDDDDAVVAALIARPFNAPLSFPFSFLSLSLSLTPLNSLVMMIRMLLLPTDHHLYGRQDQEMQQRKIQ